MQLGHLLSRSGLTSLEVS